MGVVTIRNAVASDAEKIAAAEWRTAATPGMLVQRPGEIPVAAFAEKVAALSVLGSYWVAVEDGDLVGHSFLEPLKMAANAHVFSLNIVVHPGKTERGIGAALMAHMLKWARARPELRKIELLVRATNARAISLYEKVGFVEEGRFRNRVSTPDGTFVDDVTMAWFPDAAG